MCRATFPAGSRAGYKSLSHLSQHAKAIMWMGKLQAALLVMMNHISGGSSAPTTVYFGSGCFWERQFAYVWEVELGGSLQGNSTIFNRNQDTVTAEVGYAGSKKVGPNGLVCYHNTGPDADKDDYGVLGMGEAVAVTIDAGKEEQQFQELIKNFFSAYTNGVGSYERSVQ